MESYALLDSYSDYEALDNDYNPLLTDYIINMFQEEHMIPFCNKIGVFTNNRDKASMFFDDLYNKNKENVENYWQSKDNISLVLKDEILKLKNKNQIESVTYDKIYSMINKEIIISPTEMHKIFPDFKKLIERDNYPDGEELRLIFMSMEMLISKLPIIPNKNQEDLWYRGYYDAQVDGECYGVMN